MPRFRHTIDDLPPDIVEAGLMDHRPRDERERALHGRARGGDGEACRQLGVLLDERGDAAAAESWLRAAVFFGDDYARTSMGVLLYRRGDYPGAYDWFLEAARDGGAVAARHLGRMLTATWGDEPLSSASQATGMAWLRRATGWGDAEAPFLLGSLLSSRDAGEGHDWLRLSAHAGHEGAAAACRQLGVDVPPPTPRDVAAIRLRLLGADVRQRETELWRRVESDTEEELRTAAQAGDSLALTVLGILLGRGGSVLHALDSFRDAATRGDALGARHFGELVLSDMGGDDPGPWEISEGSSWLVAAARQGDADAATTVGTFLVSSASVTHDAATEGRTWLLAAADVGHDDAIRACREHGLS